MRGNTLLNSELEHSHNLKVAGSNPAPATNFLPPRKPDRYWLPGRFGFRGKDWFWTPPKAGRRAEYAHSCSFLRQQNAKGVRGKTEKDRTVSKLFAGPKATITVADYHLIGSLHTLKRADISARYGGAG